MSSISEQMMSNYIWVEEPPKAPGYYWYKFKDCGDSEPRVALLFEIDGQLYARGESISSPNKLVRFMRGTLWAGPIEKPNDMVSEAPIKKTGKSVPGAARRVQKA